MMKQIPVNRQLLTEEQLSFYYSEGYLNIKNVVPPGLLHRLQQMFHQIMFEQEPDADMVVLNENNQFFVRNIDNICVKGNKAALELMGFPPLLQIAETICGLDFFPVQDFSVIKMKGDDHPVLWHQDMENRRSAPSFTMGIYLDDAAEKEAALQVVPRSHTSGKSICTLMKEPAVCVPAKAGDILMHDMLTAHSSGSLTHFNLRRVIYFEFLSPKLVREEAIYDEALIKRRTSLLPAAIQHYQLQNPGEPCFNWKNTQAGECRFLGKVEDQVKQVYASKIHARPSAYCFERPSI
jgi:hypothetical protein